MVPLLRLLLLSICLIPILPATGQFGWEQIKVVTFLFLNSLCGFLWLVWLGKSGTQINWSRVKIVSLIFILILLVSSYLGIDPMRSFFGQDPYFQGWILYAEGFLFMLMISTVKIPLLHWAIVLAISSTFVSVIAIKEAIDLYVLHQQIPNYAGRVVSTFGQPNLYSGFILLTIPFWWHMLERLPRRSLRSLLAMTGMMLSIIGLILSYSRASILILGGLLFVLLLSKLKNRAFLVTLAGIFVLVASILSFKFGSGLIYQEIEAPLNQQWLIGNSPEKRIFIWPIILELVGQKPLIGYGLENLSLAFSQYEKLHGERSPVYYGLKNINVDRSHNYTLDLLFSGGILGLLVWLGLVILLLLRAKGILLVGLAVYLIWVQFQIQSVVHLIYFWLLAGLIDRTGKDVS